MRSRLIAPGCETIGASAQPGRPRFIVADEPTSGARATSHVSLAWVFTCIDALVSGLDSFQADKVVDKLAELAHADGAVVLASLHAPRSASFARCDDLLLMAPHGRVAYCGPAAQALPWFAGTAGGGHACPAHTNPAEFLIDLVSIGEHKKELFCEVVCS